MGEERGARKFMSAGAILHQPFTRRGQVEHNPPEPAAMPFPAAFLSILAAAAAPSAVVVTGYGWAPFISPMGEPFRSHSATDDTLGDWFRQADRNHDGVLTVDEMQADADRFFATLDTDHNGEIDPDELVHYEWQVAPEIQVNTKRRRARGEAASAASEAETPGVYDDKERRLERHGDSGPQGAARYTLLNVPEPVAAADADLNRGISKQEFRQAAIDRFNLLDKPRAGRLGLEQLRGLLPPPPGKERTKSSKDAADTRIGQPLPPGS
jgi:Ca2+-binding EF-hand superfamily protein